MRLKLILKSEKDVRQKDFLLKYYNAMNSYVYKIISNKKTYEKLHDKSDFKPFSFGNIFPIRNELIEEGEEYSLFISSSVPEIIEILFFGMKAGTLINLGESSFEVLDVKVELYSLSNTDCIESVNILHLSKHCGNRILPVLYSKDKKLFLNQLRKNLIKKYNFFKHEKLSIDFDLFDCVDIKIIGKQVSIPLKYDNQIYNIIGNRFRFKFNDISEKQLEVFQLCFDSGFAEKNAFGIGFMRKVIHR